MMTFPNLFLFALAVSTVCSSHGHWTPTLHWQWNIFSTFQQWANNAHAVFVEKSAYSYNWLTLINVVFIKTLVAWSWIHPSLVKKPSRTPDEGRNPPQPQEHRCCHGYQPLHCQSRSPCPSYGSSSPSLSLQMLIQYQCSLLMEKQSTNYDICLTVNSCYFQPQTKFDHPLCLHCQPFFTSALFFTLNQILLPPCRISKHATNDYVSQTKGGIMTHYCSCRQKNLTGWVFEDERAEFVSGV